MKRTLFLTGILLMVSLVSALSQPNPSFIYKLQVITEGTYQVNQTGDLVVKLFDSDGSTLKYEETFTGVKTNQVALLNIKVGTGTVAAGDPEISSLDWLNTRFKIEFSFNGKKVTKKNGATLSQLRRTPYVLSTMQTIELLGIEAKSRDTVVVKEDISLDKNKILGGGVIADSLLASKRLVLPVYDKDEFDAITDPEKGAMILYLTDTDTNALYYNGQSWSTFNEVSSSGFVGTTTKEFKLESSTGDVYYKTNAFELIDGETYAFSMKYLPSSDSLIYFTSSDESVVGLSAKSAKSKEEITATIKKLGSSLITGKSKSGRVVEAFVMYVEDVSFEDPSKLYFANIVSKDGRFQLEADKDNPARHTFYAKDVVNLYNNKNFSWQVVPKSDLNTVFEYGMDSAMVVFGEGSGLYNIQIVEKGAEERVVSSMKFMMNLKPGASISPTGDVTE